MAIYTALKRAVVVCKLLQDALYSGERTQLEEYLAWAECLRLAAFRNVVRTLKTPSRRRLGLRGNQNDQWPHGSRQRFAAVGQTHRPRLPQLPLPPTRRLRQS